MGICRLTPLKVLETKGEWTKVVATVHAVFGPLEVNYKKTGWIPSSFLIDE